MKTFIMDGSHAFRGFGEGFFWLEGIRICHFTVTVKIFGGIGVLFPKICPLQKGFNRCFSSSAF